MNTRFLILLILLLCISQLSIGPKKIELLLMDADVLALNKKRMVSGDAQIMPAFQKLIKEVDGIVSKGKVYSVVHKDKLPPSSDKHDYMSQAPYWWPDPTKTDGKPYIRRDGDRNPEINGITDHDEFGKLMDDTELLGLAYFYTKNEKYAQHCARLLEAWFLNEATKMNPHLNFGQGIPGINTGRGIGIIETRELGKLCDAATLISSSKYWSKASHQQLKAWMKEYANWLVNSPIGKDEADEHNNHGTYYSVQLVALSLFTGNITDAKSQIDTAKVRLQKQLKSDGSQPHELARTLPYNYATMNLRGFFELANLAKKIDIDLWNYKTSDDKSIKQAFDWFMPYLTNEKNWDYKQLKSPTQDQMMILLKMASKVYQRPDYEDLGRNISKSEYNEGLFQLKY